jgi:hypothetical protein
MPFVPERFVWMAAALAESEAGVDAARRDGRRIVGDESSHVRQRAVKQIRINIAHFSILPPARTRRQKARAGKPNLF